MNRLDQTFLNEFFCSRTHNSVQSLQHVTMVKIAIELWNQIDLRESIVNYRMTVVHRSDWHAWRKVEKKMLKKVSQLFLHDQLKKEFISVISPIGVEIKNWWVYHRYVFHFSKFPIRLVWTSRGTIDKLKTAECLSKDEDLDLKTRYKLVCVYCLKDEVQEVKKQMDEEQKQNVARIQHLFLVPFWTYYLNRELRAPQDWISFSFSFTYLDAFKQAVLDGNTVAVKFFLDKLTNTEKNRILYEKTEWSAVEHSRDIDYAVIPQEYYAEIFLVLLSRMSESQREELFQMHPRQFLECLFQWPNRPLFVEMAKQIVQSNPDDVMGSIIKNITNCWSDCNSRQLFHHFWNLCPLSYKKRAIERIDYCTVMKLYEGKDVPIVRALFQHACAVEKERLKRSAIGGSISWWYTPFRRGYQPLAKAEAKFKAEFLDSNDK